MRLPTTEDRIGPGGQPDKALDSSLQLREPAVVTPGADVHPARLTPAALLRNLDVVLVVLALTPALTFGAPKIGYVLGGGGWILQRMVAVIDRRWTAKAADPMRALVFNLFEAFGRIWLLAGVIVLAAKLGERPDGLTAAVVIIGAYSVAFVIRLLSGPPGRRAGE
jgi:hypothetical protein